MTGIASAVAGVEITGAMGDGYDEILTPEALTLIATLHRALNPRRAALLAVRAERQARLDAGEMPDFLPETAHLRAGDWTVAPIPADLAERRVEITGPVDRKMIINALNSGANVFMADFEDANSPSWRNAIEGQINLRDAIRRTITFDQEDGRHYQLNDTVATLMVRARGWHLDEKHVRVDGTPVSGGLFDFALYMFHNAKELLARGSGPYFYLPKMESHHEARLWNDAFVMTQDALGIPQGSVRATVLIETILATFEMNEILYELRDHSAGLNCGRWDYIFSAIKKFRNRPDFLLPDRAAVTMATPFMHAYSLLTIQTCHRRGIHAMGGMAAQIPIRNNPEANAEALAKVKVDKDREVHDGHDGTWVAHPGLVATARESFAAMPGPNQIDRKREDVHITAAEVLDFPDGHGQISEAGLRLNISVAVQYLEAWLRGQGAVPIFNLMEDAATAEISRSQVWQWIRHPDGTLNDGRKVTVELFRDLMREELHKIETALGPERYAAGQYARASQLVDEITTSADFVEFLTLPGYRLLD